MTGGRSWVQLDGLSDRQLAFLREAANDWLVTKAADLSKGIGDSERVEREFGEVAVLGRILAWLRLGQAFMPDPAARELVARTIGETRHLDELKEEYDGEVEGHEAWVALLGHFDPAPDTDEAQTGDDEDRDTDPGSSDEDESEAAAAPRWVEFPGRLSDDQLRIVRKEVTGLLAGRTGDLRLLDKHPEPEREIAEIAALARLAFSLDRGKIEVPDPLAQEMVERLVEGSKELNEWEELRERYEAGVAEQEALVAFADFFSGGPGGAR
jgi:hypothetical protein